LILDFGDHMIVHAYSKESQTDGDIKKDRLLKLLPEGINKFGQFEFDTSLRHETDDLFVYIAHIDIKKNLEVIKNRLEDKKSIFICCSTIGRSEKHKHFCHNNLTVLELRPDFRTVLRESWQHIINMISSDETVLSDIPGGKVPRELQQYFGESATPQFLPTIALLCQAYLVTKNKSAPINEACWTALDSLGFLNLQEDQRARFLEDIPGEISSLLWLKKLREVYGNRLEESVLDEWNNVTGSKPEWMTSKTLELVQRIKSDQAVPVFLVAEVVLELAGKVNMDISLNWREERRDLHHDLRIPLISATYSTRSRPPIPEDLGQFVGAKRRC